MRRCLILGCSEKKNIAPDPLPAIERYDGPPFRVLRRFLVDVPSSDSRKANLDIFVLSAKFGLISGATHIPNYDHRMTKHQATALHESVLRTFRQKIGVMAYRDLFLSMGKIYLLALVSSHRWNDGNNACTCAGN